LGQVKIQHYALAADFINAVLHPSDNFHIKRVNYFTAIDKAEMYEQYLIYKRNTIKKHGLLKKSAAFLLPVHLYTAGKRPCPKPQLFQKPMPSRFRSAKCRTLTIK
jgi:hypothetical protein